MHEAPEIIKELVEKFERNFKAYKNPEYKEEQLKQEFLNPFFKALGWDVDNTSNAAPQYRDVIFEDSIKVAGGTKAPDYCFTLSGRRMFFVEAKKPSVNLKEGIKPAYQLRRYAWSAKLPLSILTDFEEFAIYESRTRPKKTDRTSTGRIMYITYKDYVEKWDEIYSIFSYEAVRNGSFDNYSEGTKKKRGTQEVDDVFLSEIETWREILAKNLALRNKELTVEELNYSVQQIIDRIIFLRMAEDRGIEKYGKLLKLLTVDDIYDGFCKMCKDADVKYNSGLFNFKEEKGRKHPDKLTLTLNIDNGVLRTILKSLYYPDSPYEFSVLSPEILGNVYEQFLGKIIRLTPSHMAKVEEKPEVKKAGGVYYTPQFIVDYIVENTVGRLCDGSTPNKVSELKILDPACGSGSFLLGAYTYLLKWHLDYYSNLKDKNRLKDKIYKGKDGEWHLTIQEKKKILLNNIYGVDIDSQAVEVTKLSLLLKVLEGENRDVLETQQKLFKERALPDLENNIKCGNSLVGPEIYNNDKLNLSREDVQNINAFDWNDEFSEIMLNGGFDAIIGNPPYVRQETLGALKDYFKDYAVYHGSADLYTYFIEKGLNLLNNNGFFSYIVANKWMRANYGNPLRKWLKSHRIHEIIDFGDLPVFLKAAAYPCILVLSKQNPTNKFKVTKVKELDFINLEDYINENNYFIETSYLNNDGWNLVDEKTKKLLDKLHNNSTNFKNYLNGNIYRGIISGLDDAFVIDSNTRQKLITEDSKSSKIIKPYMIGRDIKRYKNPETDRYLIFMPKGWTNAKRENNSAIKWLEDNYPAIANYLKPFSTAAKKRYDKGDYYWELRKCDYYNEFEKPKIIYLKFQVKPAFTFDEKGYYPNSAVWIIPSDDKYLLGILNSKLGWFMISNYCTQIRNGYQLIYKYLQNIPIHNIDFNNKADVALHNKIVSLVEQMMQLNENLSEATIPSEKKMIERQIDAADKQIDNKVYELYGLTNEEINIVNKV